MSDFINDQVQNLAGQDDTVLSEKKASRNVRLYSAGLTLLAVLIGLFFPGRKELAIGFVFGHIIAQLVFLLNEINIDRALKKPEKAKLIQKGGYYARMAIRLVTLYAAYKNPYTSLAATFFGLITIPASIYLLALISGIQMRKKGNAPAPDEAQSQETEASGEEASDTKGETE